MKKLLLLFFVMTSASSGLSQTTITAADLQQTFAFGNTIATMTDSSGSLDIGSPGMNTWDFSSLDSDSSSQLMIVDPTETPFASDFPAATFAQFVEISLGGTSISSWTYNRLEASGENPGVFMLGGVSTSNVGGFDSQITSTYKFGARSLKLPLTLSTAWQYTDSLTTLTESSVAPAVTQSIEIMASDTVDAYGTMTLPGVPNVDALRIVEDRVQFFAAVPGFPPVRTRTRMFSFVAKTGETVSVTVAGEDTNSTSGTVTGAVNWTLVNQTTSVAGNDVVPTDFVLSQNYPNPFNPETTIDYQIGETDEVKLAIFNVLGQEVRVLVDGTRARGSYSVRWNGMDQRGDPAPSGVYVYRLKVGDVTRTKKMILLQ